MAQDSQLKREKILEEILNVLKDLNEGKNNGQLPKGNKLRLLNEINDEIKKMKNK